MSETPLLSRVERLILVNQMRILEKLDPSQHSEAHLEALRGGYECHYDEILQAVDENVPRETTSLTINILSMHRSLLQWYNALKDKGDIKPGDVEFRGFNGNDEIEGICQSYTLYRVDKLGHFPELARHDDFNSHFPMLLKYNAMLDAYRPIYEKYKGPSEETPTVAELKSILEAKGN